MTAATLTRLEAVIAARKAAGETAQSHTARLLAKGTSKCAQKFGEEAVETVIAAVGDAREALIAESADMLYHWMVLLASRDVALAEVLEELDRRDGVSGLAEKAQRGGDA